MLQQQASHCSSLLLHNPTILNNCHLKRRASYPTFNSNTMMRFSLLLCIISAVTAQFNCSCSPLQYKMQIVLASQCPPSNVTTGSTTGISRIECSVNGDGNNLMPVSVTSYRITELNRDLVPVRVKNAMNVSLFDGDNVTFFSDTNTDPGFVSGGIQVSMAGVNSESQGVTLDFLVQYTNLCNKPPFAYGDSVGWLRFLRGMPTQTNTCFVTLRPTSSPTLSMKPTSSPTSIPTSIQPTAKPSSIKPKVTKKQKKGKKGN